MQHKVTYVIESALFKTQEEFEEFASEIKEDIKEHLLHEEEKVELDSVVFDQKHEQE